MVFRKKKDKEEDKCGDREDREDPWNDDETPFTRRSVFDRDPFFEDMFKEFGAFKGIEEMMNELMKNAFSGKMKVEGGQPFVYGFSLRTGPDGKPMFEEFGNVKPGMAPGAKGVQPVVSDAREPLVDVIDKEGQVIVIAELPGVGKEDINLEINGKRLEIKVEKGDKKFYKQVELPVEVKDDATDATYNNGVLEVKLVKKHAEKLKGKRIEIK